LTRNAGIMHIEMSCILEMHLEVEPPFQDKMFTVHAATYGYIENLSEDKVLRPLSTKRKT
jgi:hypothetical protein